MSAQGRITEVFCSFQGEGLYAGDRQLFIRFSGCSLLSCKYCDTSKNAAVTSLEAKDLIDIVLSEWEKNHFDTITLTGGEPLEQADFIKEFLEALQKKKRFSVHLETNAVLHKELKKVLPLLSVVSADFKLACVTGDRSWKKEHAAFLSELEKNHMSYFVKTVVNEETAIEEFTDMCRILSKTCQKKTLFLQPQTRKNRICISFDTVNNLYGVAAALNIPVRVMPQTHKFMGFR